MLNNRMGSHLRMITKLSITTLQVQLMLLTIAFEGVYLNLVTIIMNYTRKFVSQVGLMLLIITLQVRCLL